MARITRSDIKHHWPELIISGPQDVVFCSCGERFQEDPDDDPPVDQWAIHVADLINRAVEKLAVVE